MSLAYHCDADSCDSWQRLPMSNPCWLLLTGPSDRPTNHFCSLDCCMKFCATHSEPTEVVHID